MQRVRIVCPQCQAAWLVEASARPGACLPCKKCGADIPLPHLRLAGSPDDPQVSLAPVRMDATTFTREGWEEDVGTSLRAADQAVGRYVEQGLIGRGGMGEIALCVDRDIRRHVAMKRMLPATAADPSRRARFVEEAQVTGQLQHPNIVPVYELDKADDGTIYFTMKPVGGRSLADILREMKEGSAGEPPLGKGGFPHTPSPKPSELAEGGPVAGGLARERPAARKSLEGGAGEHLSSERCPPLSLSELLQVFLKVCDGVAFAHSRGVVHRDLKPANIMVGDYGEVLVMDWGLAKIIGHEDHVDGVGAGPRARPAPEGGQAQGPAPTPASRAHVVSDRQEADALLTVAGSAMGTPAYMPPEQAKGELEKIDARSDIWSLGAILYEILALERAVQGETTYAILANVLKGKLVPPEQRAPGRHVPRELSAIAMKCLSRTRARRYGSVLELRRDISLFLEGRSVSASPDTFVQGIVKLVKRNKGISAAIAAAAVLLIAVTTAFIIRLASERDRALASERRAVAESKAAKEARDQQHATALAASRRQAESAVRAASEGRINEAEARATAAVEVMPDGPWGHYALGVLAHERKDFASARNHLDEALRFDPAHGPSKLFHATVLAASGDLTHWEKLVAEADKCTDWKALVAAGDALYAAERYRPSVKAYRRGASLAEREPAISPAVVAGVKDKAERSVACAKMQGFWDSIRDLPSPEQRTRLLAKLNDVYGSQVVSRLAVDTGCIREIKLEGDVHWLDPIKGLPITKLDCHHRNGVRDLRPLRGMPLEWLDIAYAPVTDLSPLRGMRIKHLDAWTTRITSLAPLSGMPLEFLSISSTGVSDLSPLKGISLRKLLVNNTDVSDLSPLEGMPLTVLHCHMTKVTDIGPLKGMPLEELRIDYLELIDLGPLADMPLKKLYCNQRGGLRINSLAPLKGIQLVVLYCSGTNVTDLSPLAGMPLRSLWCAGNYGKGVSDLNPLRGMPLDVLDLRSSAARDLTPLREMRLKEFWPPAKKQLTAESLKVVEELEKQGCKVNWVE